MKIYFVRHTAVGVPSGVCYGQSDVGLAETFLQEATAVREKLAGRPFGLVFTSPLTRCRRLADHCGFPDAQADIRLKELDFGDWEMQEWNKLDMSVWETNWVNTPPPGGESFQEMYRRVASFLNELTASDHTDTLIFTHGGVIRCAMAYFGKSTLEKSFDTVVDYGQVVEFSR